jgi:hypothetical protein
MLLSAFQSIIVIYGAQVVQVIPRPHKSICKWCTYQGGDVLQLDPLRLTCLLSTLDVVSKVHWKGKWTWTMQRLPLHSDIGVFNSKFILMLYLPFALNWHFWWGNGVKRVKNDPVLVLNAKGGEIKAKANGSANHLWILKTIELELLICPKYSYCKIWSLVGENFDYGKRGSFWHLVNFSLGISVVLPKQVCLT